MNKFLTKILGLALVTFALAGCNKFLSQNPDDRTQIDNITIAKELAVSAYIDYHYAPLFELRSDNVGDISSRFPPFNNFDTNIYRFDESVPSTYQDSPQGYWRSCYYAVATANQVLFDLNRIGATGAAADETRGEVLMARAYAMYMLAQTFTVPYNPATADKDLGLPYPTEPEEELIKQYERGTLKELYEKITKDFEEGYKLVSDNYKVVKYHFNRQASAAFGTRLYRTLHNWNRVLELGKDAMGATPEMYVRRINVVGTPYKGTTYEQMQAWGTDTETANFLVNTVVSSWCRSYTAYSWGPRRYGLSWPRLAKGIFWKQNFVGDGSKKAHRPSYPFYGSDKNAYAPKIQEHFKVTNPSENTGFVYTQAIILSGDEVLFNMAEAYAMQNDFSKVEELLQLFVAHYFDGYVEGDESFAVNREKITKFYEEQVGKELPHPVYGIEINTFNPTFTYTPEQELYLRACLDMKRLAFIHDGMRWMDNRQFRMDIVHNIFSQSDAVEEFVVLKGTDPRYAFQLPDNVLPYLEKNPGYETELPRIKN